jgi:transcriptional regulator with XRE-family HTH domain
MAGHQKWSKLAARVKGRPGAPERLEALRQQTLREGEAYRQTLAQIRKAREVTQTRLAQELGVSQAQVSQWENQPDLYLSTLEKYLAGIGADLELAAIFPDGTRVLLSLDELTDPDPADSEDEPARQAVTTG